MICQCGKECIHTEIYQEIFRPVHGKGKQKVYYVAISDKCPDYNARDENGNLLLDPLTGFPIGNGHFAEGRQHPIDKKAIPKDAEVVKKEWK